MDCEPKQDVMGITLALREHEKALSELGELVGTLEARLAPLLKDVNAITEITAAPIDTSKVGNAESKIRRDIDGGALGVISLIRRTNTLLDQLDL